LRKLAMAKTPKTEKTHADIYEALKDLENTLKLHSEAGLFRFPKIQPGPCLKLYAIAGGSQVGGPNIVVQPRETVKLMKWHGCGHLFMTACSVVMPDATLPYVGVTVNFDHTWDVNDWTVEEYNTTLGLTPAKTPLPGYGGCTIYDTVLRRYVAITNWDYFFAQALEVNVRNWTDVAVEVDLFEMQFWSDGDYTKCLKVLAAGMVGW
jgi:hypothetical protein